MKTKINKNIDVSLLKAFRMARGYSRKLVYENTGISHYKIKAYEDDRKIIPASDLFRLAILYRTKAERFYTPDGTITVPAVFRIRKPNQRLKICNGGRLYVE